MKLDDALKMWPMLAFYSSMVLCEALSRFDVCVVCSGLRYFAVRGSS